MKYKFILSVVFTFFLLGSNTHAQIKDVVWEPWMQHPCYKGLSVSVLNMGWGKEPEGYLWGVRIRNDYNTAVTFEFNLIIGTEKLKGTRAAYKLKPGETWTDGRDVFTANLFKTSSNAWTVEVGEVCFDGMRCGGDDDCYADCDVVARKVNQLCGLEAHTSTKKEKVHENPQEEEEEVEIIANNEDKYSFDKTTYWRNSTDATDVKGFTMSNNELFEVIDLGFPDCNYNNKNKDAAYKRVAADKFKLQEYRPGKDSVFFTRTSPNSILNQVYTKNEVRSYHYYLIATHTEESLPQATNETITAANANGSWKVENWIDRWCLKITLKDDIIDFKVGGSNCQSEYWLHEYIAKKKSTNTYEFKSKECAGTGRLVFLSSTRICISFTNNEYVSVGYYYKGDAPIVEKEKKPEPPIVKKVEKPIVENKPTPVTENKTVSASCELNGEWKRVWIDGYSEREVYATIKTTADGLNWSLPFRNENLFFKKTSSITYRCDPGASQQWWYYYILTCEKNNTISLKKYHKQDGHHEVTETYSQSK